MKVGDLVKCKDDRNLYFGYGMILEAESRMILVRWFEDNNEEWVWKISLEVVSESR